MRARGWAVFLTVVAIVLSGTAINYRAAAPALEEELPAAFTRAASSLHLKQYTHSLAQFDQILRRYPSLPEAHVNRGFSLLGLERFEESRQSFRRVLALRPGQANAYFGLALAEEGLGNRQRAIAAMQRYLHVARPEARHRRVAAAALWEWGDLR